MRSSFLKRLFLFIAFVAALHMGVQIVLNAAGYDSGNFSFPNKKRLDSFLRKNTDILYFGDSVIRTKNPADADKRSIPEMLAENLPQYSIGTVDHPAYQMDLYLEYCRYIVRNPHKPRYVVLPINLRSFSPDWDLHPAQQFEKEKLMLRYPEWFMKLFLKPLSVFKAFNLKSVSEETFMNAPVYDSTRQIGKVRHFDSLSLIPIPRITDENRKERFIFHYGLVIPPHHRKLESAKTAARILQNAGIHPIFYITPIDWESGVQWIGPRAKERIAQNADIITAEFNKMGIPVLDLSLSCSASAFYWNGYVNEHLNEMGRKFVADKVAEFIKVAQ